MVLGFGLFFVAALLLDSALSGRTLAETIRGDIGTARTKATSFASLISPDFLSQTTPASSTTGGSSDSGSGANVSGSPKSIIDNEVLPIARSLGIDVTPQSVTAANAAHGPTVSGGRSDHQGPPEQAWAADMSNGSRPTPAMDRLAARLASKFNIPWNGSGLKSVTHGGYRYQLIYRTFQGGNHFNHVHFGVRKV